MSCTGFGEQREDGGLSGLQFHGEEGADYCRGWDVKVIKAFRLKDGASLAARRKIFPRISICWIPGRRVMAVRRRHFRWEWLDGHRSSKADSFGRPQRGKRGRGD